MEIKKLKIAIVAMIALSVFSGCATERNIVPTLSEPPRIGLDLKPPVLGAVFDG